MNILGLIIFPFWFLFNSYFIGKIFQKTDKSIHGFFSFSIGFIFLIFLISILSIPFNIVSNVYNIYPYALLGLQVILFIIYIINFRRLLFSFLFNWNKIIIFILTFFISIIFWISFIFLKKDYINISANILQSNNSVFNYFVLYVFKIFQFTENDIKLFFIYSIPITLIFPVTTGLVNFYKFNEKFSFKNFISYIALSSFFALICFSNIEFLYTYFSFFLLSVPIIFYFFFNNLYKKNQNSYWFYINILIFYLVFLNLNFLFLSVLLSSIYAINLYSKKEHFGSGKIWQNFIYLIGVFSVFFLKNDILISLILLAFFVFFISLYLLYKKNKNYFVHQFSVEKYLQNKIKWFFLFIILTIVIAIIIATIQNKYSYNINNFVININKIISTENIIFWIGYIFCFVFITTYFLLLFLKDNSKKDFSSVFLSYVILIFFNPLSISFVTQIQLLSNSPININKEWILILFGFFFSFYLFTKLNKIEYNYFDLKNNFLMKIKERKTIYLFNYSISFYLFIGLSFSIFFINRYLG